MIKLLIFLINCIVIANSFFFGNKKKGNNNNDDIIISKIKGIPEYLENKYININNYSCNNQQKVIQNDEINDEYCDCLDGSDEPGTSACSSTNNQFHCINKDYKTIIIPTSRVDDGICDCCDGSDEGKLIKCTNTCLKAAEKEKELINKYITTYKLGIKNKEIAESSIRSQLESLANSFEQYESDSNALSIQVESLKPSKLNAEDKIQDSLLLYKSNAILQAKELLDIHSFDVTTLLSFTSSLFESLDLKVNDIRIIADLSQKTIHNYDNDNDDEIPSDDIPSEENTHSEDDYEYGDEGTDRTIEPVADIISDNCISSLTSDDRLSFLCDINPDINNLSNTLIDFLFTQLFPKNRPFIQIQSLIGYYRLYHTFDGSLEFTKQIIESSNYVDVCPSSLESLTTNTCSIYKNLLTFYGIQDITIDSYESNDPIIQSYQQTIKIFNTLSTNYNDIIKKKDEAKKARDTLQTIYYPLYYYNNQQVSVKDGAYTYTFTILDKVTQNEDSRSTLLDTQLGTVDSIEELDNGNYLIKFSNGDHCWNVGPRSACITLTCGIENQLVSANEPSTCNYSFEMESPLACNKKYAINKGILNYINN